MRRKIFCLIIAIFILFSFCSCGGISGAETGDIDSDINGTEARGDSDNGGAEGSTDDFEVFPEASFAYSSIVDDSECIGNKLYIHLGALGIWERDPSEILELKIIAVSWFDVSPSYDKEYWNLYSRYARKVNEANEIAAKYELDPTEQNRVRYETACVNVQKNADSIKAYIQGVEDDKNQSLVNHFETMGISCEVEKDGIRLKAGMESILTLSKLDYVAFIIWEDSDVMLA